MSERVPAEKKERDVCNELQIKITLNDAVQPAVYINYIDTEMRKSGFAYKEYIKNAQDTLSKLQLIIKERENEQASKASNASSSNSVADEIRKFKALLDDNIITQEEFEAKKKELLQQ